MLRNGLRLSIELFEDIKLAIGTIVPYYRENHQPENFLICDGRSCSGYELEDIMTNTPDLRGKFIRMIGGNAGAFGFTQEDAIRNIVGSINIDGYYPGGHLLNGTKNTSLGTSTALYIVANETWSHDTFSVTRTHEKASVSTDIMFDASKVVPTSNENRPINVAMSFLIYAGKKKKIESFKTLFIYLPLKQRRYLYD